MMNFLFPLENTSKNIAKQSKMYDQCVQQLNKIICNVVCRAVFGYNNEQQMSRNILADAPIRDI